MSPVTPQLDWYNQRGIQSVEQVGSKWSVILAGGVTITCHDPSFPIPDQEVVGGIIVGIIMGVTDYTAHGNTTRIRVNKSGKEFYIDLPAGHYSISNDPGLPGEHYPQRGPAPEVHVHPGVSPRLVQAAVEAPPATPEQTEEFMKDQPRRTTEGQEHPDKPKP